MKSTELRTRDDAELLFDLKSTRKELFGLRMKATMGTEQSPSRISELRRSIARMLTILRERQLGVRGQSPRTS